MLRQGIHLQEPQIICYSKDEINLLFAANASCTGGTGYSVNGGVTTCPSGVTYTSNACQYTNSYPRECTSAKDYTGIYELPEVTY